MKTLQILIAVLIIVLVYIAVVQAKEKPSVDEQDVVRAHAFELVDDKGKVRANLMIEDNGEVVFRMRGQKGEIRVKMGAGDNGSGLVLLNGKTEVGVHTIANDSATFIHVTDAAGNKEVVEP